MKANKISALITLMFLTSVSIMALEINFVKSSATIYIREDGTVDPPTAPIQRNGDIYTFTGDIYESIVIERNDTIITGAFFKLEGSGSGNGIYSHQTKNLTIQFVNITNFQRGIYFSRSANNTVHDNNITYNDDGVYIDGSAASGNNVVGNNISHNSQYGIGIFGAPSNTIFRNEIASNAQGIQMGGGSSCANNQIFLNKIISNNNGIQIGSTPTQNIIYHNFFDNVNFQASCDGPNNAWDNGYPSGGNFWIDHSGPDISWGPNQDQPGGDGIIDLPYIIDGDDQDNYPLLAPYMPNIVITSIEILDPTWLVSPWEIIVTVANHGTLVQEFDVAVIYTKLVDPLIGTQSILLLPGFEDSPNFPWFVPQVGTYEITAYTSPISDDIAIEDNTMTIEFSLNLSGDHFGNGCMNPIR